MLLLGEWYGVRPRTPIDVCSNDSNYYHKRYYVSKASWEAVNYEPKGQLSKVQAWKVYNEAELAVIAWLGIGC